METLNLEAMKAGMEMRRAESPASRAFQMTRTRFAEKMRCPK
jgi:hypothetical protein